MLSKTLFRCSPFDCLVYCRYSQLLIVPHMSTWASTESFALDFVIVLSRHLCIVKFRRFPVLGVHIKAYKCYITCVQHILVIFSQLVIIIIGVFHFGRYKHLFGPAMPKENCNSNIRFLSFIVLKLIGSLCWSIKLSLEFRVTVHNTESKPLEGKCVWLYFSVCILSSYSLFLSWRFLIHYLQYLKQHFHLHFSEVLVITLISPEEPLFSPQLLHAITFHQEILSKLLSVNHSQLSHDYNIALWVLWSDILQTMLSLY